MPTPTDPDQEDSLESETLELVAAERRLEQLAGRPGMAELLQEERLSGGELLSALGGLRGIVEAVVPGIVFVAIFALGPILGWPATETLMTALGASLGLSVILVAARFVRRSPSRSAIAGLIAAAASAAIALLTGRAEDNYLLGIIINAVSGVVLLGSIFVRWPLLGVFIGVLTGRGGSWRSEARPFRLMVLLTALWTGLFVVRLAVEVPLYLSGQVVALGVTKLALGTPLYALLLVLTWLVVRAAYPATRSSDPKS